MHVNLLIQKTTADDDEATMYDVHLGLIGKRVVDFLLVIIEFFLLDVTAKALRAKIDRKSAISLHTVTLTQNFR